MKIYLDDKRYLFFDEGKFDSWCVYEVLDDGRVKAPFDVEYFSELKNLTNVFGSSMLYDDFVKLYNKTTSKFDKNIAYEIRLITNHYDEYKDEVFRIFSILYMGMLAEKNKANTRLGKRVKRLGMYNLLVKNMPPEYCADFMKGMKWQEIDKLCNEDGF